MSADLLREAASIIRERAEAATPGPWEVGDYWHIQGEKWCRCDTGPLVWSGVRDINGSGMRAHVHRRDEPIGTDIMQADASDGDPANVSFSSDFGPGVEDADATHIATFASPAVALAVAKAMDDVALAWEIADESADGYVRDVGDDFYPFEETVDGGWLAVARTYLNEPA